jgi:plasmid stability protein
VPQTIRIDGIPDEVLQSLEARAAEEGRSLEDYVLEILQRAISAPTHAELRERLAAREPVPMRESSAALIRAQRGE